MCDIAGIKTFSPQIDDIIRAKVMIVSLINREPDEGGIYCSNDRKTILRHCRLVIIDLNNGCQPMMSKDNGIVIVFDGEIYNYF